MPIEHKYANLYRVLLGTLVVLLVRTAAGGSLDVLVSQYHAPIVMDGADPATPQALEAVAVLDQTVSELLATRSYHTLPNAVVIMGSGINSAGSGEMTTALYSCPPQGTTLHVAGGTHGL